MNTGENRSPSISFTIREAIRMQMLDAHVMLPGKIKTYYANKGTIDVDLLIKQKRRQPDGTSEGIAFPTLMNVPVAFPRCAAGAITFPLAANDLVMVHFADRNLGDWVQAQPGQVVEPGNGPAHDLNGAIAYPGCYPATDPLSPAPSTQHVVIRADNELHLGGQDPSSAVALANPTNDQLQPIINVLTALLNIISGPPIPEPGSGSPSAFQTALAAALVFVTPKPSYTSVAASKVKAI